MDRVMLPNIKKRNYHGLIQFKNLRKVCLLAVVVLLSFCMFAIHFICTINTEIANAESSQNSNVIQNAPSTDLYLVGEFTNWQVLHEDKYRLQYFEKDG